MKHLKITNEYYSNARPEMVNFVPKDIKTILDVGCGEGVFALSLKNENNNLETWGVEINSKIAEIAKNLVKVLVVILITLSTSFQIHILIVLFLMTH